MAHPTRFLALLFLLSLCFAGTISSDEDCVYTLYVRTGSTITAGTDSIIGINLYDTAGWYIKLTNLESWGGLMDPGHNYFERGNLDIFSGRAPCLDLPVCAVNLTSDGSGYFHGWYCNYVEVTSTGEHKNCTHQHFTVEQWLATDSLPPRLWAFKNNCGNDLGQARLKAMASDATRLGSESESESGSGSGFSILGSTVLE